MGVLAPFFRGEWKDGGQRIQSGLYPRFFEFLLREPPTRRQVFSLRPQLESSAQDLPSFSSRYRLLLFLWVVAFAFCPLKKNWSSFFISALILVASCLARGLHLARGLPQVLVFPPFSLFQCRRLFMCFQNLTVLFHPYLALLHKSLGLHLPGSFSSVSPPLFGLWRQEWTHEPYSPSTS